MNKSFAPYDSLAIANYFLANYHSITPMKNLIIVLLCVFIIISSLGCAVTKTAYIRSETDPRYTILKNEPIAVFIHPEMTIEERKISLLLKEEMKREGFNIVDTGAEYLLTLAISDNISKIDTTIPQYKSENISGRIGLTPFSARKYYWEDMPYSYDYHLKGLCIVLYSGKDLLEKKYINIWVGGIGAEKDVFDKYTRPLISELLKHYGGNYNQQVVAESYYSYEPAKPLLFGLLCGTAVFFLAK